MKQRTDYYEQIAKQEEKSAKLKREIDREFSPEDRKLNMIKRTLKLREGE